MVVRRSCLPLKIVSLTLTVLSNKVNEMFDTDISMPNYERPSDKTILIQVSGFGTFLGNGIAWAYRNC